MIEQILEGVSTALLGLLTAGLGYLFYGVGKYQVEVFFTGSERYGTVFTKGTSKWKAAVTTFIIAVVIGLFAAGNSDDDEIPDDRGLVEVDKIHRYESFSMVFVFIMAASGLGIAKATTPTPKEPPPPAK